MPNSNLAAYLAKNYLTASTASSSSPGEPPKKKRKKSRPTANSGLVIADDDEDLGLSSSHNGGGANEDNNDDGDVPIMFQGSVRSAEFRRAKKNAWQSLAGPTQGTESKTDDDDVDDADRLLRTAQSDEARRLAEQEAENAPAVVNTPRMESGARAGLQTAADTARLEAEEQEATREEEESNRKASKKAKKKKKETEEGEEEQEQETVYRDATGRRIDLTLRRAEARREEAAREQAARQEKIDAMGDVQRRERDQRRQDLESAKFLTLGRSVEDDEYNAHLRDQVRWDDPMAAYMLDKAAHQQDQDQTLDDVNDQPAVKQKAKKGYVGSAAPNRYGIRPGRRWDGVDRGNGFEALWFQARSRRDRNERLGYEWQMDE